jgi:hypothetical protein
MWACVYHRRESISVGGLGFLRYIGGGGKPEFMPVDWTCWRAVIDYLKNLISATAVQDSIATIGASWDDTPTVQHSPDGLVKIEQYFSAGRDQDAVRMSRSVTRVTRFDRRSFQHVLRPVDAKSRDSGT